MEFWDIYDAKGNFTGKKLEKGLPFGEDEYHFAIEAWLINDNNELLIQQRSLCCETLPGCWALTTGRITSGENSIVGCIREVKEELGISITEKDLHHLARFSRKEKHLIWDIFLVYNNTPIEDIVLQPEEVNDAKWVSISDFKKLVKEEKVFVYAEIEDIIANIENIISG